MGLAWGAWQQEEDISWRLELGLRLRKFSVVSRCGKGLRELTVSNAIGPSGAGPYRVSWDGFSGFGQIWEKRSGYEKKIKKTVDGICGFDTLSIPLMSDSKFLSDLWGKSAFFDNGVFFCLVTDKGIQSTAVLF